MSHKSDNPLKLDIGKFQRAQLFTLTGAHFVVDAFVSSIAEKVGLSIVLNFAPYGYLVSGLTAPFILYMGKDKP